MIFGTAREAYAFAGMMAEMFDRMSLGGMGLECSRVTDRAWVVQVFHNNDCVQTFGLDGVKEGRE